MNNETIHVERDRNANSLTSQINKYTIGKKKNWYKTCSKRIQGAQTHKPLKYQDMEQEQYVKLHFPEPGQIKDLIPSPNSFLKISHCACVPFIADFQAGLGNILLMTTSTFETKCKCGYHKVVKAFFSFLVFRLHIFVYLIEIVTLSL